MKIQQIIDEQMKEFDFSFYPDLVEMQINYRDSRKNITVATIDDFKSFILSYTHKLIEAVGEEIMDVAIDQKDECPIVDDVLRQQRLKLKEIINSLK